MDCARLLPLVLVVGAALAACAPEAAGPSIAEDHPGQLAEAERTGFPVEVGGPFGMRFRLAPAGAYLQGSPPGEAERREEEAQHDVHLVRPWYLQTTEVTNAQFRRFRPDHESGATASGASLDGDQQPVVNVSWDAAAAYAEWLTEQDPRFVYRLPTEAEWEYCCRAGAEGPYACGSTLGSEDATVACGDRAPLASTPVGSCPPNAWGFFDLHGNVGEWCHDRYGPYPLWRMDSPQGAAHGDERVVRGGAYDAPPPHARSAARGHADPATRAPTVGFRLAHGLGYGRTEYGRYRVRIETIDPTVAEGEAQERPGWPLYMLSVMDRLTDRVNRRLDPRWIALDEPSPIELNLAPGLYYITTYRMKDGKKIRSIEQKFAVPGTETVRFPIPRPYQENPQ